MTSIVKLPVPMPRDEKIVERGFWKKLRRVAGRIPFAEDAAAAYFCAMDPKTPPKVRAILFAALAYFVLPFDLIPSFIIVLIGFTSDAAVIALALSVVGANITEEHRAKARAALDIAPPA
ncbi:MAG TPA: YkvA family protein [Rhizomicrobium sp.]|nr:YkvA family protein [Rhizomicrobium sp.]